MKLVTLALFALSASASALAGDQPYPTIDERAPDRMECLASNARGQRFLGRQADQQSAFEETLYQCYVHTNGAYNHSCKVVACRVIGGTWRRLQ